MRRCCYGAGVQALVRHGCLARGGPGPPVRLGHGCRALEGGSPAPCWGGSLAPWGLRPCPGLQRGKLGPGFAGACHPSKCPGKGGLPLGRSSCRPTIDRGRRIGRDRSKPDCAPGSGIDDRDGASRSGGPSRPRNEESAGGAIGSVVKGLIGSGQQRSDAKTMQSPHRSRTCSLKKEKG